VKRTEKKEWERWNYLPTKSDTEIITQMWTSAFLNYPLYKQIIPDDDKRKKLLPFFMKTIIRYALKYGTLVATSPDIEGAVFYLTPDQLPISTWKMIKSGALKTLLKWPWKCSSRFMKITNFQDEKLNIHAPQPFTYLANGAVRQDKQGMGIISRFVKSIIIDMDNKGIGCYCETFKKSNAKLYNNLGLKLVAEYSVPDTELTMYCHTHNVGDPI
jgi:hypothetical protein